MDFVNFKKQKEKLYFYTERPDIYCVADLNKGTVYDSLLDETFYDFTVLQKYIHIDEGKQQNNCVGSFYNDNILCGRDYIYFIRRKDNPKKSVATARYNVNAGKTIELKEKNNKEPHEQFWTFAKEIDELINNYLK